jgi:hypothetical protein
MYYQFLSPLFGQGNLVGAAILARLTFSQVRERRLTALLAGAEGLGEIRLSWRHVDGLDNVEKGATGGATAALIRVGFIL